ncbi:MAG TPA: hypothetical protein VFC23_02180 [Thermoanaerobaculia bacterium]|nr:hypothetical protein [Thermoanaerobaculia bacterium]
MRLKTAATTLVLLLMAGSAGAQFQYTAPGGPEEKPASRQEALALELSRARYRLGPLRVAPWAALHDVAYVRSLLTSGQQLPGDFTATAGAGFHAYLRNGPKVTWNADVLPEYVWWRKQASRRRVDGRYLLGFHGFFNRLTVEATAGRQQRLRIVTPEVPVLASSRQDSAEVLAELELSAAVFAFASAAVDEQTNLVDVIEDPRLASLRLLDRRERVTRGGLRWQPRQELSVALGVEGSRVDFARTALPRSNSGTAPLVQLRYRSRRLGFSAELASRSLSARQGSDFVPYHQTTGNAALELGTGHRFGGSLYASRNLLYALTPGYAYLQDDRVGMVLRAGLSRLFAGRVFAETGTDDYTAFTAGVPHRRDDVSSFGAGLDFRLGEDVTFGLQAVRSRFVPNLPIGTRTFTSAGVTVSLGAR